jgi:hypothetical protein
MKMETTDNRTAAKMEMISITAELMPGGKPNFPGVRRFQKIAELEKLNGRNFMLSVLTLMVKDFCSSLNVVRNMNEDQMIEVGAMLLEECDNYRLEDYVMMFNMAKKGTLVDIHDRIDLQVITRIMDAYHVRRARAAQEIEEAEDKMLQGLGSVLTTRDQMSPQERALYDSTNGLAAALDSLRAGMTDAGHEKTKPDA